MRTDTLFLRMATIVHRIRHALMAIGACVALVGCEATCCIITRFETEPQWVCPGKDLAAKAHIRLENFDEEGDAASSDLGTTWALWNTTTAPWDQPGAISLTNKVGALNSPGNGVQETPAAGVLVLSSSQTKNFELTLTATNKDCDEEAEKYLISQQTQIEKMFDLDLIDTEPMTARTRLEVVSSPATQVICVPHVTDVQGGLYWTKDEKRAGPRIVIDGLRNLSDVPLQVSHSKSPVRPLAPQGTSSDFDGVSPNGKWEIGVASADRAAYDAYINHRLKYVGKPAVCLEIGLRCK